MLNNARPPRGLIVIAAALFAVAACSKDNSSETAGKSDSALPATSATMSSSDLNDVTTFKMSMDGIDKFVQSHKNIAAKLNAMSPAEREALNNSNDMSGANMGLDDMVAMIDKQPMMVDAIKSAGLSTREWVLMTMSIMQTGMAAAVLKTRPNDNQDSLMRSMKVNPDNVRFYNEHEAEITAKMKAVDTYYKSPGGNG